VNRVFGGDYFGFVYIWMDRKKKKFCIGSHMGSVDDGYLSSTGWFKQAYRRRPDDFRRRILFWLTSDDQKLLRKVEQMWLDLIPRNQFGKKYYNIKPNSLGGNGIPGPRRQEWRDNISLSQKGKKKWVGDQREKLNIDGFIAAKQVKKECEFCQRSFDLGNYGKYHGINCRLNPDVDPDQLSRRSAHASYAAKKPRKITKPYTLRTPIVCEGCGDSYQPHHYYRWHGDNCKKKVTCE
jgi:hypothetical protein